MLSMSPRPAPLATHINTKGGGRQIDRESKRDSKSHTQAANLLHKHNFETDTRRGGGTRRRRAGGSIFPCPSLSPSSSPAPLATHILGTSWKSRQQIAGNPRKWLRTTGGIRASQRDSGGVVGPGGVDGVATYFAEPHNFCAQQKTFARSQ